MKVLSILAPLAALLPSAYAQKLAFAHVVMGDTAAHTQATWATDISLAKAAGLDAFVLNMGYPDSNIPPQVANAFAAANAAGNAFKLFFAFDYLGGGTPWPATGSYSVVSVMNQYKGNPAYQLFNGMPMASTFEGTTASNIADWAPGGPIRSAVGNVYFVPDWTSLGPSGVAAHSDSIQGAFSWDMWPNGAVNSTDTSDLAWKSALGSSKSYMMGISPWFFHSASGGKDWVWRGDSTWANRWGQVAAVNPQFVQVVSWNDFAEGHYIGPVHSENEIAPGSAVYVDNMPHESWRDFLPYYISQFKGTSFTISRDQMQYWYRQAPAAAGSTCGVVGNNANQGQTEVSPNAILEDGIFFSALLQSPAEIRVAIGTNAYQPFHGVAGINHFSRPFNGQTGAPSFKVYRNGVLVAQNTFSTAPILSSTQLSNGCTNYNCWVGSF
jgi:hypothetical protein